MSNGTRTATSPTVGGGRDLVLTGFPLLVYTKLIGVPFFAELGGLGELLVYAIAMLTMGAITFGRKALADKGLLNLLSR